MTLTSTPECAIYNTIMSETPRKTTWSSNQLTLGAGYRKALEENIFKENSIMELLEKEQKKVIDEMAKQLEQGLWGSAPTRRNEGLRRLIAEAYDEHHVPKEAEEMEAVDEIVTERERERARAVFADLDEAFENSGLDSEGAICTWTVQFDVDGKEYRYAAVLTAGCWYITGKDTVPRKPEAFKAYLAEKALEAHKVEFEGQVL